MHRWDKDAKEPTTRTLWKWGIAGQRFQSKRWENLTPKQRKEERKSWKTREHRNWQAERSRQVADITEGIGSRHDQENYGTGPFGGLTTGSFWLRMFKRKAS